ncbi:MAG: tRNA (guanosine(37)-N1)-methyltransferase TrmD [Hyphomicrobiaceae bacterium]
MGGAEATLDRNAPWRAVVVTLFPQMFPGPLEHSLAGSAMAAGRWSLEARNLRDHGIGRHAQVDDTPAGGGAGLVLRCDVVAAAIEAARNEAGIAALPGIYLSPRGEPLSQALVQHYARGPGVLLLAGRFEGVDERAIEACGLREISIGDYVLSGGELAAMVLIDACVRLLPGVMGRAQSADEESFADGLLEYPQFTRPREWRGRSIPDVLVSGDHAKIAAWRRAEAEALTQARRPDLILKRSKP